MASMQGHEDAGWSEVQAHVNSEVAIIPCIKGPLSEEVYGLSKM